MSTLNLQVAASLDDARENQYGYVFVTGYDSIAGGIGLSLGLRFQSVSGLENATINTGTLTFRAYSNQSGNFIADCYAEDGAAPGAFSAGSGSDITGRTRTTATCEADGSDLGSWTAGNDFDFAGDGTNTIAEIIQELASSYDPSTIVLLLIWVSGTGIRVALSYDNASATAPKLVIDYTAATGDQTMTPDAVTMPLAVPSVTLAFGTKTLAPDAAVMPLVAPVVAVKPATKTLTPDPVTMPLVAPSVSVVVAIVLTPNAVTLPLVAPSVALEFGTKTLTPDAIAMPLVVPVVTLTGVGGAILFDAYKWARTLNPAWWPTGTTFYVVAMLRTSNAATPARARLFNITDGLEVTDSELSTTATTTTEAASSSFSLPSGEKLYRVEVGGLQGGEFFCENALVKAVSA